MNAPLKNYIVYYSRELKFWVYFFSHCILSPKDFSKIKYLHRNDFLIPIKYRIPWITFKAIKWLEDNITKKMRVFEFGAGGSTLFFADRVKEVISVENDEKWYSKLNTPNNCKISLLKDYSSAILAYQNEYFDLVFIDGVDRNKCIVNSINKIKKGGYLVLDDSDRNYEAEKALADWKRIDFYGMAPLIHFRYQTTIFKKP